MKIEKMTCCVCGQKSKFPVLKKNYWVEMEHYARYCPKASNLAEQEMKGVIQHCPNCGYVFLRIDEKTKTKRAQVDSEEYQNPFGNDYQGPKEAVECFQLAVTYKDMNCRRLATQWFIYGAILLEYDYPRERNLCYRNALFLLEQELSSATLERDIEIYLAYLNVLRMIGLVDVAEEFGNDLSDKCRGLDKRLVKTIVRQAKLKNTNYMTYADMLLLELCTDEEKKEKNENE